MRNDDATSDRPAPSYQVGRLILERVRREAEHRREVESLNDRIAELEQQGSKHFCSFCLKGDLSIRALFAGPSVFVCDECVTFFGTIVAQIKKGATDTLTGADRRAGASDGPPSPQV